jgi:hypothetical protein
MHRKAGTLPVLGICAAHLALEKLNHADTLPAEVQAALIG